MHVVLKALSVRNVVDHTEWKTTDLMAWCCKANPKSNPPREATAVGAPCPHIFKCLNYKGEHSADDTKCPFWYHHFDRQWHSNKAAELHTGHAGNSNIQCPRVGNF